MPKRRDLYQKYEGLSPVYQGWLTNHLPMLYTLLLECDVEEPLIEDVLDAYKQEKDLYELTDLTYPTSETEQAYINQTGQYLAKLHQYGTDVVFGEYLNDRLYALPSALYHGLIRLAYAKRSNHDLLIAQGLAYFDIVHDQMALDGTTISTDELKDAMSALERGFNTQEIVYPSPITTERYRYLLDMDDIKDNLVVLPTLHLNPRPWLSYLLRRYRHHGGFFTLHTITAFHALTMVEELIANPEEAMRQWMLSSQVMMLLDSNNEPLDVSQTYEWDEIIAHIHELGDAHRMKLVFSLYELDQQYGLDDAIVIASALYSNTIQQKEDEK